MVSSNYFILIIVELRIYKNSMAYIGIHKETQEEELKL